MNLAAAIALLHGGGPGSGRHHEVFISHGFTTTNGQNYVHENGLSGRVHGDNWNVTSHPNLGGISGHEPKKLDSAIKSLVRKLPSGKSNRGITKGFLQKSAMPDSTGKHFDPARFLK
jgi:hypothetical protein